MARLGLKTSKGFYPKEKNEGMFIEHNNDVLKHNNASVVKHKLLWSGSESLVNLVKAIYTDASGASIKDRKFRLGVSFEESPLIYLDVKVDSSDTTFRPFYSHCMFAANTGFILMQLDVRYSDNVLYVDGSVIIVKSFSNAAELYNSWAMDIKEVYEIIE